jgi:hypothetical protein
MAVTSRATLTEYCLRALGEPVVEINVDDSQLEERIDEALDYWSQYHFDGAERMYLKARISASQMRITSPDAGLFPLGSKITGNDSGATAIVCSDRGLTPDEYTIVCKKVSHTGTDMSNAFTETATSTFIPGETVTCSIGDATAVLGISGVTLGTYDLHYFEMPDYIYGVTRVIPFNSASSSKNLFDMQYQLRLNDLYDLTSTSLIYYKTVMSHISLLNLELNGYPMYRFNRMMGRMMLDVNWETALAIGDFVLVECYRALDPATFSKVWNEPWFRHYVTALFKRQWATNIKKFQGIQLPGGVTIDGDKLYQEAITEIKALEDEMVNKAAPLEFFLG